MCIQIMGDVPKIEELCIRGGTGKCVVGEWMYGFFGWFGGEMDCVGEKKLRRGEI